MIFTKRQKRALKRHARHVLIRQGKWYDRLEERVELRADIDRFAVNGVLGLDWDKMDCDHARWGGHSHIPATVTHFIAWEHDFYDGAEGPQSGLIVEPRDDRGIQYHRDLALEAHENGHPHCIHY